MSDSLAGERPLVSFSPDCGRSGPIVAAVDGLDAAGTLRAARTLAAYFGVNVLAVNVVEPLPIYLGGLQTGVVPPDFEAERKAAALERLDQQVRDVVGSDPTWQSQVVCGDVSRSIAQLARAHSSPMIIMGIGRQTPIDRIFATETTIRTIHRASCPVLAVTPNFNALPRQVVIATDLSPASALAAESAAPLIGAVATVSLTHVWQRGRKADPALAAVLEQIDARHLAALPHCFARFTDLLALRPESAVIHQVREGDTVRELLDYAATHSADLIVAGRHGIGPFVRFVGGSVTAGLLRGATCSVLVTPEPRYSEVDRLDLRLTGLSE